MIGSLTNEAAKEVLHSNILGRLGCGDGKKIYVVPVNYVFDGKHIIAHSVAGMKIHMMRKNPKVCLQADEIGNRSNWTSVVVTGTYLELNVPQYHTSQREHARERLAAECSEWWRIPLSGARDIALVSSMETVFFRIDIKSISGLRAIPEAEEPVHQGTGH